MTENTKKKSLSAQEYPVNKIFCDDYVLEIPSYQRPYSWTTEQASELVMDLQDYIKGKRGNIEGFVASISESEERLVFRHNYPAKAINCL